MATKKRPVLLSSDDWADVIVTVVKAAVAPLARDLETLRTAQKALEEKPAARWGGTYERDVEYREATLITHGGGLWVATKDTADTPGSSPAWKMIVKSGAYDRRG